MHRSHSSERAEWHAWSPLAPVRKAKKGREEWRDGQGHVAEGRDGARDSRGRTGRRDEWRSNCPTAAWEGRREGGREAVGIPGITTSLNRRTRTDRRNAAAAPTAPTPRDTSEVCARAVYIGGGGTGMAVALTVLCCQG